MTYTIPNDPGGKLREKNLYLKNKTKNYNLVSIITAVSADPKSLGNFQGLQVIEDFLDSKTSHRLLGRCPS